MIEHCASLRAAAELAVPFLWAVSQLVPLPSPESICVCCWTRPFARCPLSLLVRPQVEFAGMRITRGHPMFVSETGRFDSDGSSLQPGHDWFRPDEVGRS